MVCWLLYITIVNVISTMLGGADVDGYEGKIKGILYSIYCWVLSQESQLESHNLLSPSKHLFVCNCIHTMATDPIHLDDDGTLVYKYTLSWPIWFCLTWDFKFRSLMSLSTTWAWDPWYFSTKYYPLYLGLMSSTTRWVDPILHKRYLNVHLKGTIDHGRYRPKGISLS